MFRVALSLLATIFFATPAVASLGSGSTMRVSALVGKHNASAFECWEVHPPFSISAQAGTVGAKIQQIGNIQGATVVFFNESGPTHAGLHAAPAPQWVLVLSGGGVVSLPTTGQKLPIPVGSIIIANDTSAVAGIGHNTDWSAGSVAVQLPFAGGVVNHTLINEGPCADRH